MLLLPGLVLVGALAMGSFAAALDRVALEVSTFQAARQLAIGNQPELAPNLILKVKTEGRLSCAEVTRPGLIALTARHCMIRYGG